MPNEDGEVKVLTRIAEEQSGMGEALTVDSIAGSADAEIVATGPSGKGDGRGAILRHGRYTLWSFAGSTDEMTPAGVALFVNTVAYAARQGDRVVLEKRMNGTRDSLFSSIAFARRVPGYLSTMRRIYLPEELAEADLDGVERWLTKNRAYVRTEGRRFVVDEIAKELRIPNHRRVYLKRLIENLGHPKHAARCLAALRRYTGVETLRTAKEWGAWYRENARYLHFSDCEGFRFKVDEEAKRKRVPFEKLRGWSSEEVDYRFTAPKR